LSFSLKPARLKRYKDVLLLLVRHGRADLLEATDLDQSIIDEVRREEIADGSGAPEDLARDLEALGPTFVKLGQVLSSRPDLLPPAYLMALSRLQDHVEPIPFEEVREVVEADLGVRLTKAFTAPRLPPYSTSSSSSPASNDLRAIARSAAPKARRSG
jgi:predicted unusual protein kinase regulating ubiquinone biosynthesis (AarF/ABC1/UbiB family)